MINFGQFNLMVREVVNGAMALAALLLIWIFARYCWRNRSELWRDEATIAAAAILVLMIGHFLRAFSSWIEFMLIDLGRNTNAWVEWTWITFLISGTLIITGKAMILRIFAPLKWRWTIMAIGIPACVLIPIIIAVLVARA